MEPILTLEEKIHIFFKDEVMFTAEDVERKFPDENKRSVYRALNKLEDTNRIRFLKWANRKKIYTAQGQSSLPMIKTNNGTVVPISMLINVMPELYDENGRFKQTELDRAFILMCQLFVIAQGDSTQEMHRNFLVAHKELVAIREFFTRMTGNIDAVLRHPAMQGDVETFKRAFYSGSDPALPTANDLIKFRTWVAKTIEGKQ